MFNLSKLFAGLQLHLASPSTTLSHAIIAVVAITQSEHDWTTLFGVMIGAKVFVCAKWIGAYCTAAAAAGRSVVPSIDNPTPTEGK